MEPSHFVLLLFTYKRNAANESKAHVPALPGHQEVGSSSPRALRVGVGRGCLSNRTVSRPLAAPWHLKGLSEN